MNKYILVDRQDGREIEINKKEALKWIAKSFKYPNDILKNASSVFNNRIDGMFRILEIRK